MKVKFGAIIVDGRNKVGGHVLSKNRSGAYMRTKVTPVNPQTVAQTTVRNSLGGLSQNWANLTQAQRDGWDGAVSSYAKTDIFGDIKNPSGINLYVKLNRNLQSIGAGFIDNAPLKDSPIGPVTIALTGAETGQTLSLAWTGGVIPADTAWLISATPQTSPGKSFVKNLYRDIIVLPAADATPTSIDAAYIAKFGALVAGQKISLKVQAVSILTGVKGLPLTTNAIVGA